MCPMSRLVAVCWSLAVYVLVAMASASAYARSAPEIIELVKGGHLDRTSSRGLDKTHVSRYRSLDAWVVAKAVDEQTSA